MKMNLVISKLFQKNGNNKYNMNKLQFINFSALFHSIIWSTMFPNTKLSPQVSERNENDFEKTLESKAMDPLATTHCGVNENKPAQVMEHTTHGSITVIPSI